MRRNLRITAVVLLLASAVFWAVAGANRGWTQTHIPKPLIDEVTGIEGIAYETGFKPGLDFLGAVVVGAGLMAGASFLFRNDSNKKLKPEPQLNHPESHA